jgi:hypothetical protein
VADLLGHEVTDYRASTNNALEAQTKEVSHESCCHRFRTGPKILSSGSASLFTVDVGAAWHQPVGDRAVRSLMTSDEELGDTHGGIGPHLVGSHCGE